MAVLKADLCSCWSRQNWNGRESEEMRGKPQADAVGTKGEEFECACD